MTRFHSADRPLGRQFHRLDAVELLLTLGLSRIRRGRGIWADLASKFGLDLTKCVR